MNSETRPLSAEDVMEIQELVAEWSLREDAESAEQWANLFTADGACFDMRGEPTRGREDLCAAHRRRRSRPEAKLNTHWPGPVSVEATSEGARAHHYCMVAVSEEGKGRITKLSQRTWDVRREGGRWRVYARYIAPLPARGAGPS